MPNTAPTVGGKPNPLSNIHARMALAYATDRDHDRQADRHRRPGADLAVVTHQPVGHAVQPERLRQLRPDQGQGRGGPVRAGRRASPSLTFTLSGLPELDDAKTLQQLQAQWKQAGITVNIETLEQTAYITKIATGGYQAAFFRNYGYPDPDQDYYFWSSTTAKGVGNISINFTQYTTPQIDTGPDHRARRAATPSSARPPTTTWSSS